MNITLFGGTGATGRLVVEKALAAGHQVIVYARNPAKLTLTHANLTVVAGELTEAAKIDEAVQGADAVISLLGPTGVTKELVVSNGLEHILAAMKKHGVQRLVATVSSSYRDAQDRPQFWFDFGVIMLRLLAKSILQDIERTGQLITQSQLDWTLIRLPKLSDKLATEQLAIGYTGDGRVSFFSLSRADLADFLLRQLDDNTYVHHAPVVSNR
jgi:putative NADH-flavin reductase